jgi:MerR family transcriptional regulator, thiopeptide resistance regulator
VIPRRRRVHQRLVALRQTIHRTREPSIDELIDTMETIMHASYFTPEQLERARHRHQQPGFAEKFTRWQARCAHLVDEINAEIRRDTDPADPAAQAIARRWTEVMHEMTDGDRHTLSTIYAKIDGIGPEAATRGVLDADAWDYLRRAFAVGYNHHA